MSNLLHEQLQKDCFVIGQFKLCILLLMNDKNYPWFILVPARQQISEIYQLSPADRLLLIEESSLLARLLDQHFKADKLNIAAIGNIVPQLHVHHVVRYRNDPAWPAPVWGKVAALPYRDEEANAMIQTIGTALCELTDFQRPEK